MGVQMKCSPPPLPSPADEGTFSCQVPSFFLLVLLADRHWNMPYCWCSMRVRGEGEGVCMCVRACVCVCAMSNKVDTLSSYPTPLGSVCHVKLVPASMSCTVCLCSRSQLVARPGLSPVLPAPAVSAHL